MRLSGVNDEKINTSADALINECILFYFHERATAVVRMNSQYHLLPAF